MPDSPVMGDEHKMTAEEREASAIVLPATLAYQDWGLPAERQLAMLRALAAVDKNVIRALRRARRQGPHIEDLQREVRYLHAELARELAGRKQVEGQRDQWRELAEERNPHA